MMVISREAANKTKGDLKMRLVTKKAFLIPMVTLILMGLLVGGCAAPTPSVVTHATYPVGGTYYTMSVGMANVWAKNTNFKVVVEPFKGTQAWADPQNKGD